MLEYNVNICSWILQLATQHEDFTMLSIFSGLYSKELKGEWGIWKGEEKETMASATLLCWFSSDLTRHDSYSNFFVRQKVLKVVRQKISARIYHLYLRKFITKAPWWIDLKCSKIEYYRFLNILYILIFFHTSAMICNSDSWILCGNFQEPFLWRFANPSNFKSQKCHCKICGDWTLITCWIFSYLQFIS